MSRNSRHPLEEVLALAVKVDVEAFDALVECNNGLEFAKSQAQSSQKLMRAAQVKETGMAWTDRQNRLAWIPECMRPCSFRCVEFDLVRPKGPEALTSCPQGREVFIFEALTSSTPGHSERACPRHVDV